MVRIRDRGASATVRIEGLAGGPHETPRSSRCADRRSERCFCGVACPIPTPWFRVGLRSTRVFPRRMQSFLLKPSGNQSSVLPKGRCGTRTRFSFAASFSRRPLPLPQSLRIRRRWHQPVRRRLHGHNTGKHCLPVNHMGPYLLPCISPPCQRARRYFNWKKEHTRTANQASGRRPRLASSPNLKAMLVVPLLIIVYK